jgi:prepilin-type N-terminal cleavage/methylation domain-containing protein
MTLKKKRQKPGKLRNSKVSRALNRLLRKLKGLSLIEVLIAVAIIGILITIGIFSYTSSQKKARDSKRKFELNQLQKSLEMYYNDYGSYPPSSADGKLVVGGVVLGWGDEFKDEKGTIYMKKLPKESRGPDPCYVLEPSGQRYAVFSVLENSNDPKYSDYCQDKSYSYYACGNYYNYAVMKGTSIEDFGAVCKKKEEAAPTATPIPTSLPTNTPTPLPTNTPTPRPTNTPTPRPTPTPTPTPASPCPTGTCQTTRPDCPNYCSSSCQVFYGPGCSNNPNPGSWYVGCGCRAEGETCGGTCPSVMCCDGLGCNLNQKCVRLTPTPTR